MGGCVCVCVVGVGGGLSSQQKAAVHPSIHPGRSTGRSINAMRQGNQGADEMLEKESSATQAMHAMQATHPAIHTRAHEGRNVLCSTTRHTTPQHNIHTHTHIEIPPLSSRPGWREKKRPVSVCMCVWFLLLCMYLSDYFVSVRVCASPCVSTRAGTHISTHSRQAGRQAFSYLCVCALYKKCVWRAGGQAIGRCVSVCLVC